MALLNYENKAAQNVENFAKSKETDNKEKEEQIVKNSYEKRDKSMRLLITPSTHKALMDLKNRGVIKSANDLINDLLEEYIKKNI